MPVPGQCIQRSRSAHGGIGRPPAYHIGVGHLRQLLGGGRRHRELHLREFGAQSVDEAFPKMCVGYQNFHIAYSLCFGKFDPS